MTVDCRSERGRREGILDAIIVMARLTEDWDLGQNDIQDALADMGCEPTLLRLVCHAAMAKEGREHD